MVREHLWGLCDEMCENTCVWGCDEMCESACVGFATGCARTLVCGGAMRCARALVWALRQDVRERLCVGVR